MVSFFSLTRRLASKHGGRRVPRSLQDLPTPNVHRSWGNLKSLSAQEKAELVSGAWRASKPIQLVPDKTDRDGGGFAAPVTFASEEEAHKFLAEEDADDAAELQESTLALAQRFFVELATTADAELDVGQMPPVPQSDEDRRREMRDVQRQFFADFYVEQGLISEAERYPFVDALLRPSRAFILVNSTLPLVRLTVRDQLESHQQIGYTSSALGHDAAAGAAAGGVSSSAASLPVFATTNLDACLYVVPQVPTQSIGAPLYVPYTAATSLVGPPENGTTAAAAALEGKGGADNHEATQAAAARSKEADEEEDEAIDHADLLSAMLQDDFAPARESNGPVSCTVDTASKTDASKNPAALMASSGTAASSATLATSHQPPSLAHTYWLQRQIASNALLNVDLLSHAISLLSVQLAAASQRSTLANTTENCRHGVILYLADTTAGNAYHAEIAQYLFRAMQEAATDDNDVDAATLLRRLVLVVEDATFSPRHASKGGRGHHKRLAPSDHLLSPPVVSDASEVPVADRYPNVVYVAPTRQRQPSRTHQPQWKRSHPPLRGCVVVCAPTTSQDGVRPRGWLASEDADDDADGDHVLDSHDTQRKSAPGAAGAGALGRSARLFAVASPDNFVERCQLANANFTRLQRSLYRAIRAVDVCGGGGGSDNNGCGYVIYATQSLNVLENEAVVCAVLQRVAEESRPRREAAAPSYSAMPEESSVPFLQVECVSLVSEGLAKHLLSDAVVDNLRLLRGAGRRGLSTWVAIEGGSAAQEADHYSEELRSAVAEASWRTDPMRCGDDGGYLICLRVRALGSAALAAGDALRLPRTGSTSPAPALCWWTHPQTRATSAVSSATLNFLRLVLPPAPLDTSNAKAGSSPHCTVLHAGVPVGFSSHPASSPMTDESDAAMKGLPAACDLSSAIAHADVLSALSVELPVLRLSVLTFSELLLAKKVSSRAVRRLLRLYEKQHPVSHVNNNSIHSTNGDEEWQAVRVRESTTFLAAVEELIRAQESSLARSGGEDSRSSRRLNVVVVADPTSFLPSDAEAVNAAASPFRTLHPAVVAELHDAGVVAQVDYTPRTAHKATTTATELPSTGDAASYNYTVQLSVPLDMPERAKHLAALEEWCVALRDALLYVSRRTGVAASTSPRLWSAEASLEALPPHAEEEEGGVRLPRGNETNLELADDEYEAVAEMPERFQRHLAPVDLLAEASGVPADDARDGRDWLADRNYREWLRRRSRR